MGKWKQMRVEGRQRRDNGGEMVEEEGSTMKETLWSRKSKEAIYSDRTQELPINRIVFSRRDLWF